MKILRPFLCLSFILAYSCSTDDSDSSSENTAASSAQSCDGGALYACQDYVGVDLEVAQQLCDSGLKSNECEIAAGTKGCKFEMGGNVGGYTISWDKSDGSSPICGGEEVTK